MASQDNSKIIPVDDFVREELYPGYTQEFGSQPFVAGPVRPFSKADNARYWLRDSLHFSEGMVPASIALLDDAQTWGAQLGAEIVGVPLTGGSVNRLAGTHVYLGTIDVGTDWQIQARAARFSQYVTPILADFDRYWDMRASELKAAYSYFDALDFAAMDLRQLWAAVMDGYSFHRRAWFIHFEVMYVLTANYLALYQLAEEIGLDGSLVSTFLSGRQTFYSKTDEELWRLAGRARELDVTGPLLHADPADVRARLEALPHGRTWWNDFDEFLKTYGRRTEETCRIDTPSWIEEPSPALYAIAAFLSKPSTFDFQSARDQAAAERDAQIDAARRTINGSDLRRFNEALASNLSANFAWWNEEHNYLIDRRAAIPVRRASLELGARLVDEGKLDQPDDIFFLFKPELYASMEGCGPGWPALASMIPDRRAYFEHWRRRGAELPIMLGTIPNAVPDPIMIEVFGLSGHFLESLKNGAPAQELRGFPAAKGVAKGVARVISSVTDLNKVKPGEIMVCGGTTTEWTPAFGIIGACVCDTGGSLTHAAIVSREYGIPCVVGTAMATKIIKTGDLVRVDGRQGTVQIFRSQPS